MSGSALDLSHVALARDGTISRGKRLFDTTLPFLDRLGRLGIGHSFLTNNSSLSKADDVRKLRGLGIDAPEPRIFTPADSAIVHLQERHPGVGSIGGLGTPSLCLQFEETGFALTWDDPGAVVVGFDTRRGLERDRVVMVGDRVYTDVVMAQRAGVGSVLVLSGEANAEDAAALPTSSDLIVADVGELGERLEAARGAVWWGDCR